MIHFAKVPHTVRIFLTKRSNLNCGFCLINASINIDANELKTEAEKETCKKWALLAST